MTRFRWLYVAPTLLLLALAVWPLINGSGTLYTRDVLTSHYPLKASQAEALTRGELPLIDPYRAGGQPLLGNPNALPLYPDNLLYLVASPLWALNAHFWLHLLLAPLSFYWLGRAWGLSRPASWAGGVCYVSSGFFLSLLNLYNLVAGAALAPAFIAACLDARGTSRARARRRASVCAGVLWGLLILAGDPLFAALALFLAITAMAMTDSSRARERQPAVVSLGLAVICGTLLTAPMLIEMARILPLSFRGYWQFSMRAALSQSWDPRSAVEWLLPFFFGRPDFTFWGTRFYGGNPPLLYSLYPGLLGLGLVALSGRPRRRVAWWSWAAISTGLFLATGAWNPVVRGMYHLPGASALRYPVKLWLLVAIGASVLCALGFERLLDGDGRPGGGKRLGRFFTVAALFYLTVWGLLAWLPTPVATLLQSLDPARLNSATLARESARWSAVCIFSLVTLGLFALALRLARRRARLGGGLLLAVHLLAQGFFLNALYDADDAELYTRPSPLLSAVPAEALVVHGGFRDLFGPETLSPLQSFPDPRFFWLARLQHAELHPFAGIAAGRRYELNHSPEGLDSFFSVSLSRAIQQQDDVGRLRLLSASGVDRLILSRELAPEAAPLARLEVATPGPPRGVYVYSLPRAARQVELVGTVLRAPQMNSALAIMTSESFDPRTQVVLPGPGQEIHGTTGTAGVVSDEVEELVVETSGGAPGVLVTRRAFLDIYRVTIDGEPATPVVANLHRLAVEVPPGEHRVRLWVDRRPTRPGWLMTLFGGLGLVLLGSGYRRRVAGGSSP